MIGIISILIIGFLVSTGIGIFGKSRALRLVAWCISGFCAIGLLVFVYAITHFLQR